MRKLLLGVLLAGCGGGGGDDRTPDADIGTGTPTAYRFNDLDLRDPHIFVQVIGCSDFTDSGAFVVNDEIQTSIETDGDNPPDGLLDLSATIVFRPLVQDPGTNGMQLYFADCTAPIGSTMCRPGAAAPLNATATNMASGTCLAPVAGTTTAMYNPQAATPGGPCFASDAQTVTVDLSGIPVTLQDAQVAAAYVGTPATGMMTGLMMGFLTEADANASMLPADLPLIGGDPLSSVLPGGGGNCAGHDDRDSNGGTMGWWFYLNFTAVEVPWSDT